MSKRILISFGTMLLCIAGLTVLAAVKLADTDGFAAALIVVFGLLAMAIGAGLAWWMNRSIAEPLRDATIVAKRMALGDLSEPYEADAGGELGELQFALQEMCERMFKIVSKVRLGTVTVATTAGFINTDNTALSSRTESQASSLEETASSMEELTSTVRQNADNARQANKLVAAAANSAVKGGQVVHDVVETMGSIKESSRKIVDIISVIDGIAFQTNILALNAAVEAARAGEEGRGFAVVASEVRSLAQRAASAAKEIKELISDSVAKVETGGQLVDEAGHAMNEIVANVKRVEGIMSEIAAASSEQSSGIEEVNKAVMQIDGMTQKNASMVEEASRTAASLLDQAVTLQQSVAVFDLGAREYGSSDEAVELVRQSVEFAHAHGRAAIIEEVNQMNKGRFIDRDLYISIYSMEGRCVAHGANHRLLGVDAATFKDLDGKFFIKDILAIAKSHGDGWVEYKWTHPLTKEAMFKSAYFERVGDLIISCGAWSS
ncbi:MAG: cache domain-containing protein [Burkholderiales bacterium]|nr:cache domain-containing protein [Burkholderiales bacterium]